MTLEAYLAASMCILFGEVAFVSTYQGMNAGCMCVCVCVYMHTGVFVCMCADKGS